MKEQILISIAGYPFIIEMFNPRWEGADGSVKGVITAVVPLDTVDTPRALREWLSKDREEAVTINCECIAAHVELPWEEEKEVVILVCAGCSKELESNDVGGVCSSCKTIMVRLSTQQTEEEKR